MNNEMIQEPTVESGVYAIKNNVNGKCYVGSSANIRNRVICHKSTLRNGKHHSHKLQRAWEKYGESNFSFETLLICKTDDLFFYEQLAMNAFAVVASGYNILPIAGGHRGRVVSDETRAKISAAGKGRKRSDSFKARRKEIQTGMRRSEETKAKISATMMGRRLPQSTIDSLKIRPCKVETREKARENMKRIWAERKGATHGG